MRRSMHLGTYFLIFLNIALGVMLAKTNWNINTIVSWGGMYGKMPAIQMLNQLPPFIWNPAKFQAGIYVKPIGGMLLVGLRAIYASFLHFSWGHLLSNMLVLLIIGRKFENINYMGLILPVYIISGMVSMIAAYIIQPNVVTAGASGALFGIMGACLVLSWRAKYNYHRQVLNGNVASLYVDAGNYAYGLIVFNLISSVLTPNVSLVGHVSGLIAGLVIGMLLPLWGHQ